MQAEEGKPVRRGEYITYKRCEYAAAENNPEKTEKFSACELPAGRSGSYILVQSDSRKRKKK